MDKKNKYTNLPEELYLNMVSSMPIICTDIIPVREKNGVLQIGVIKRATGKESGKFAILGGRVALNETITEAIERHLFQDLSINRFSYFNRNSDSQPFYVQQYFRGTKSTPPYGFDPSKHSITPTYLITITDTPTPKNEASEFKWITKQQIPNLTAYNQNIVMKEAFNWLSTEK